MENTRVSSANSESSQLLAVSSSPSLDLDHPDPQQVDHGEECRRLQGLVKKLKSDKKALQNLLLNKELDIQQLLQAKADVELELQKWQNKKEEKSTEEQTLSEETENLTQKVEKLEPKLEEEKRQMAEDTMEKLSKNCCTSSMSNSLSLSSDCKEEDEIVTFIQSIFRAHLARTVLLEERPSVSSEKPDSAIYSTEKKPVPAALQRPPPISMSSVPGNLISLCVQKSSEKPWQPTPSLPGDEAHSDDSDDVVIVPSLLQMKKNYTHF
ncbi:iq domain-containing protein e isoform x1 [Limosa lapponica baueri]|uniref:Iq domain-containing protein e isoform x1 n=1 Tax=Limosa lapponica baueri TaxID=1758121 RepID=A0A2I0TDS0_LIMLA|nr:iq domain-containing protein e isoform x1 [Limosa lapponica baueri]